MVQTEIKDGRMHHYSDLNYKIRQIETANIFEDAMDVIPCPYTYEETDEIIVDNSGEADEKDYQEALSELGVAI